ncbi:DUF3168 domain-containing protein [Enterobacter hormaechei]|uniref:tail completion protein gp17 n=1 Tax=Enterobacter hormaechei TaxID=158836 RepID=UPI0018EBEF03|nr:DUF3168 domain-containing protein [Enterobacter hormaechei]MBJ6603524.1 DUF3168 domain-containing protein [Enterobacter hormaechei]HAS1812498.1 DUF3168 domain-containing protein [Enterobacter hormaechei subsp. xiangfangensis]HBM2827074.1 DUF3168 domain-containing protein [Enterobacter hormaechei subsp. xiangfangensis]
MTEDDLFPLLEPLAGGQVYPYVAPLGSDGKPSVSPPWIIFSIITEAAADVLCGQAESAVSVQVDVYSSTITEARTVRNMALEALQTLKPENIVKTPGYEPDLHFHRARLEFQVIV